MRPISPLLLLGMLLVAGGLHPGGVGAADAGAPMGHTRAREAYAAMQAQFAIGNGALYRERVPPQPGDRRYSYLWPFSQALAATLDVAAMPGGDRTALARAGLLGQGFFEHYWDDGSRPPGGASYPLPDGGGDKYYDDNVWIGLDLIEVFRATGDRRALDDAARVFAYVVSGWDHDPTHPSPGGIFWTQSPDNRTRDRNTVSNAPAAELGLHLYAFTGDRGYLDWAERLFQWVERTLKDPADGLYWDHIQLDGEIERTKWSYNQGSMLGAAALFSRYTGDRGYLGRAREIAAGALAYYGRGDRLWAQDPPFNAIFFRNLHLLAVTTDDDATMARGFYAALAAYTERVWTEGRDPATGLCHFGRPGPVGLLEQAAATQLFALLATAEPAGGAFADAAFAPVWARGDAPVAAGRASRTWLWGPGPDEGGRWERFDEGPNGRHLVQYFDKSRMEINGPNGDRNAPYFVTQGLLASDMILGRVQVGLARFERRAPAAIPFGDPDDQRGPTYASLTALLDAPPRAAGALVGQALGRDGTLGPTDPRGVRCAALVAETQHCVASPFWDYLNGRGPVYEGGAYGSGPLFMPLFYATGLPIAEAYWTELKVGGKRQPVLVQAFERRILTYNPANQAGWQVEMGNVGRHYFQWRYGRELPPPIAVPAPAGR